MRTRNQMMRVAGWILLILAILMSGLRAAEDRRTVPADGKITISDPGCRDWGPELVHFTLDTDRFRPGKLALLGPDGKAVPFQIDGTTLSFVASVAKGSSATWTLQASETDRSGEGSTLTVKQQGVNLEAGNELFTLRMAAPTKGNPTPVWSSKALPPTPVSQWRVGDGRWLGGMRWAVKRKFVSYQSRILRNGPVCFEYEARYRFEPRGEYVWRVRVLPGVPFAEVTEELDSGELLRNNEDFLVVDLHKGMEPKQVIYVQQAGEATCASRSYPFRNHIEKKKQAAFEAKGFGGTGAPPPPAKPEEGLFLLDVMVPAGKWGGRKGGVVVRTAEQNGLQSAVGIVPMHVGSWRRAMALNAWSDETGRLLVGLPLDARWIWWQYDVADERSPFSTHEHDRDLADSYARRVWALYFGTEPHIVQPQFGAVGLDRFKEWVLDWPEDKQKAKYPRAYFTPDIVAEVKAHMGRHPDAAMLAEYYVISGDREHAEKHADRFLKWITSSRNTGKFTIHGLSHYRQAGQMKNAHWAEDALACPTLDPEKRRRIRKWLAVYAYLMADPDFNPRGAGVHLGNNNMTINRTIGLSYFASLLPDHPCYDYWMARLAEFTRFKLATQTGPDGTWIACPNYQLYGPTRFLDSAINILSNTGTTDLVSPGYHADVLWYTANLTMEDVRFNDLRIIPGMGNSGDRPESVWGLAMRAAGQKARPWLLDMHRRALGQNGVARLPGNSPFYAFNFMPWTAAGKAELKTSFFPTYGVMFRNHYGTPHETSMLFRAGQNWSHWDTDVYNVILYGEGAPLSPGTGYGYGPRSISANNAIYHNRVKIVAHDKKEIFGRVDAPIRDYGFGRFADYAMGDRYYPPELYEDGKERHWRRHVLFVKGQAAEDPTYFVMRDTFPGNPATDRSWWTWLNLGEADDILVDGRPLDPKATPRNKVPELDKLPIVKGRTFEMKTDYGAGTHFWFANDEPLECRARVTFDVTMHLPFKPGLPRLDFGELLPEKKETKTIFEAMAGAGEDYFYVVYPHKDDEELPKFERLGEHCIKVITEVSADYLFVSDEPIRFEREGVLFEGRAGAVRVFKDRVAFSMNSGTGRIGYGGNVVEGAGPFDSSVKLVDGNVPKGTLKLDGGYPKRYVSKPIGRDVVVRGEEPFEARLDGETILIRTEGRARVLVLDRPAFIRRPQYWIDGKEWMACWTDWPSSGFGRWSGTHMMALTVPAGKHELVVRDMVFPSVWERPFSPAIEGALRQ